MFIAIVKDIYRWITDKDYRRSQMEIVKYRYHATYSVAQEYPELPFKQKLALGRVKAKMDRLADALENL